MKNILYASVIACISLMSSMQATKNQPVKLPIVYHDKYNITFWGLDSLHPFDSRKYGKVYSYLVKIVGIAPEAFYAPKKKVTNDELLKVHTQKYLDSLNSSSVIAKIAEMSLLGWLPNFLLQWRMLDPMRYATQGTIDAAFLALKHGWAINLSGGYHHAKSGSGEGFCVFADIPLAIKKIHEQHPNYKVLIVDLDAHQGNGHEMICGPDERVSILDIYNGTIYPYDLEARKYVDFDYPLTEPVSDEEYLSLLKTALEKALEKVRPDIVIYNAGTDIYERDPLGRMAITKEGIIKRDALVFSLAQEKNISVVMVLSGGYTQESAQIIGESIENLLKNVIMLPKKLDA